MNEQVTREDLETLCSDLFPRVSQVIQRAIAAASGVGSGARLVVAGGASRVPAVQNVLKTTSGLELSRSINADEAATMGAVYRYVPQLYFDLYYYCIKYQCILM